MMNKLDTLFGIVGCVLSGFGLLAGLLIPAKWVFVVAVVGLLMMGGALVHDNCTEHEYDQSYDTYNRW